MPTPILTITGVLHDAYLNIEEDSVLLRVCTADGVLTQAHATGDHARTVWASLGPARTICQITLSGQWSESDNRLDLTDYGTHQEAI